MAQFQLFEFTPEIMDRIRERREIPIHFYNKDGQILIYQKADATQAEIDRLFRFVQQGIYFNLDDSEKLGIKKPKREIPEGLTDTKLLSEETAKELTEETSELFTKLKQSSVDAFAVRKASQRLSKVFTDFEEQPDAMTGLVNIVDVMKKMGANEDVTLAVKRTVVAMSMKTRGMQAQNFRDRARLQDLVNVLMVASLMCDIGLAKMKAFPKEGLSGDEMNYIRNHPIMSYLMIAHEPEIDFRIKRNILHHHRPLREGMPSNNYPSLNVLTSKLKSLEEKYKDDPTKNTIAQDVRKQLDLLTMDLPYDEDANIIALASEFASLTSDVSWRPAFEPETAVKMIINNSYFTYTGRIIREFLDHIAISLCDNSMVLKEGDYIIVAFQGLDQKTFFEVCVITSATRYQSKPGIDRLGTIVPEIERTPKLRFRPFDPEKMKPDTRFAHYELLKDDTRHIIYVIDAERDPALFEALEKIQAPRRAKLQAKAAEKKQASS